MIVLIASHVNAEFAALKCCQVMACPSVRQAETFLQRGADGSSHFSAVKRPAWDQVTNKIALGVFWAAIMHPRPGIESAQQNLPGAFPTA